MGVDLSYRRVDSARTGLIRISAPRVPSGLLARRPGERLTRSGVLRSLAAPRAHLENRGSTRIGPVFRTRPRASGVFDNGEFAREASFPPGVTCPRNPYKLSTAGSTSRSVPRGPGFSMNPVDGTLCIPWLVTSSSAGIKKDGDALIPDRSGLVHVHPTGWLRRRGCTSRLGLLRLLTAPDVPSTGLSDAGGSALSHISPGARSDGRLARRPSADGIARAARDFFRRTGGLAYTRHWTPRRRHYGLRSSTVLRCPRYCSKACVDFGWTADRSAAPHDAALRVNTMLAPDWATDDRTVNAWHTDTPGAVQWCPACRNMLTSSGYQVVPPDRGRRGRKQLPA